MRHAMQSGQLGLAAVVAVLACGPVAAQSSRSAGSTVSSAQVIRMPASRVRALQDAANSTNATRSGVNRPVDAQLLGGFPAPGLGFDYTHQSAVNRNLATRALIDPLTQHRRDLERQSRRGLVGVPIAMPVLVNNIQVVVVTPQPVVILPVEDEVYEEETPRVRRASTRRSAREVDPDEPEGIATELVAAARPAVTVAPREVTDLVLIHRDGSLTFATAFVLRNDRITYVTREGHRRSMALSLLDLEATRDMNESLGTSVKLQ